MIQPEEIRKCKCHCHKIGPDGAQCRCIKNCIHCHPENFVKKGEITGKIDVEGIDEKINRFMSFIKPDDRDVAKGVLNSIMISYMMNIRSALIKMRKDVVPPVKTTVPLMLTNLANMNENIGYNRALGEALLIDELNIKQ